MNTDNQLRAIYQLTIKDGLSEIDRSDIRAWVERAGPQFETKLLYEKSRERITAIFNRFFQR